MKITHQESNEELIINISKIRPSRYIDEYFKMRCMGDLQAHQMYPCAKEVTESVGCWHAVRNILRDRLKSPTVAVYDIACGTTPRNAAIAVHMTPWQAVAIDPLLRRIDYSIRNLTCLPIALPQMQGLEKHKDYINRVERIIPKLDAEIGIVLAVHSHCDLYTILDQLEDYHKTLYFVAIECCISLDLHINRGAEEVVSYQDHNIWSPHRTVTIYRVGPAHTIIDIHNSAADNWSKGATATQVAIY